MAPFKVRLKQTPVRTRCQSRHLSACHDRIQFKAAKQVAEQLEMAVQYCKQHSCKGYAALATGNYPLIKDPRTINRRLEDSKDQITTGEEKDYCRVLTKEEESTFVAYLLNKNR